jgi:hypothetical protein
MGSVSRNAAAIPCQAASMTPALLVVFGLKTFRHPWRSIFIAGVAPWARSASTAASAGVLAFPGSIRVSFTNPAAVLAE